MAERSFKEEVQKLKLGAGETFRGEGILAVTKALLQSGVSYVSGYQGAPISHLVDVLADANDILQELGIRFEASANEAAAAATLAASVNYPLRGAATFKSTVGTNVASDALANLASSGVTGGALIIVGEDYGEGSSIMQERSHAFAMKSQMWLLDPRPNLPSIVQAVEKGFELSEASNTPVMLELRIRACHVHGSFATRDNVRPAFTLKDALENPVRDTDRIVLPPASYLHEKEKIEKRWPAAVRFVQEHKLNEFFDGDGQESCSDIGIVMQGGMYNTALRALEVLGLADVFGGSRIPLYVLNVTYPLIDAEFGRFCAGKRAILIIEEGQPEFIEQAVNTILRRADIQTRIEGKGMLPMAGEYTGAVMKEGVRKFIATYRPDLLEEDASSHSEHGSAHSDHSHAAMAVGSPPPASAASGGEGSGVGGWAARSPLTTATPLPTPPPSQVGLARLAHDDTEPGQARVPWGREAYRVRLANKRTSRKSQANHRRQGAWPPAVILHRLPGAADLRRHEARRARTRRAPRKLRHRLPPVLGAAALQRRQLDDGLRARRRGRGRTQRAGEQARHRARR